MKYDYKVLPELAWAIFGAVVVAVALVFANGGFEDVTTWEGLSSMLAAAGARSVGVAIRAAATTVVTFFASGLLLVALLIRT